MSPSNVSTDGAERSQDPATVIAFQGAPGAFSEAACMARYPAMTTLPCKTFSDTFAAVTQGHAGLAMIPIENSAAGRVADIHQLLPESNLHIVEEHFERVRHNLLACPGADPSKLETVRSHVHALSQCRKLIARRGLVPIVHADTAGAAAEVAATGDPTRGCDRLPARRRDLWARDRRGEHRGRSPQHDALRGAVAAGRSIPARTPGQ